MMRSFMALISVFGAVLVACGNPVAGKIKVVNVGTPAKASAPAIPDDRLAALEKLVANQKAEIERLRQSAATCAAGRDLMDLLPRLDAEMAAIRRAPDGEQNIQLAKALDEVCPQCLQAVNVSLARDCRRFDNENIETLFKRLNTDHEIQLLMAIQTVAAERPGSWDLIRGAMTAVHNHNCERQRVVLINGAGQ